MGKKLYVGNLGPSATAEILKEMFAAAGCVLDAKISVDRKGASQGFAFVDMASEKEVKAAVTMFHATDLGGRALVVNEAKPPAARDQRRVLAKRRNRGRQ